MNHLTSQYNKTFLYISLSLYSLFFFLMREVEKLNCLLKDMEILGWNQEECGSQEESMSGCAYPREVGVETVGMHLIISSHPEKQYWFLNMYFKRPIFIMCMDIFKYFICILGNFKYSLKPGDMKTVLVMWPHI